MVWCSQNMKHMPMHTHIRNIRRHKWSAYNFSETLIQTKHTKYRKTQSGILTLEWMIITFLKNYGCIHCFLVRDAFEPSIPHSGITHHCSLNCLFMLSRVFFLQTWSNCCCCCYYFLCCSFLTSLVIVCSVIRTYVFPPCKVFSHWNRIWWSHIEWKEMSFSNAFVIAECIH